MGYNTVVFLLNDFMDEIAKAPKTVAWLLSHPVGEQERFDQLRHQLADENKEPVPHHQALEILPTFHADERHFYMAGGNCIEELKFRRYSKGKDGKFLITLEAPDWLEKHLEQRKKERW